jgi:DNA replicative helicase MCM subunit Mcm2 (Cdc46/Mcm family)
MKRDDEAKAIWREVYPDLSEGKLGMFGAMTARLDAIAVRLSMIYALLDCSPLVRAAHLKAALAIVKYCEDSAASFLETACAMRRRTRFCGSYGRGLMA